MRNQKNVPVPNKEDDDGNSLPLPVSPRWLCVCLCATGNGFPGFDPAVWDVSITLKHVCSCCSWSSPRLSRNFQHVLYIQYVYLNEQYTYLKHLKVTSQRCWVWKGRTLWKCMYSQKVRMVRREKLGGYIPAKADALCWTAASTKVRVSAAVQK